MNHCSLLLAILLVSFGSAAHARPPKLGVFASLTGAASLQTARAEVDWVDGYRPTPEEAMRDNTRLGVHVRAGVVAFGRYRVGASLSYHGRLPKFNPGYELVGAGVHLAFQGELLRRTAMGAGLDIEKLISTTNAIDAGFRVFPHFVWDIFAYNQSGNRHGVQLRFGLFFEFEMDGPPMTEMSFPVTIRPQVELGWVWGGY